MGISFAVRAIHLVDCTESTQAAVRNALKDRAYQLASFTTVNQIRRYYASPSRRGDVILAESKAGSLDLASLIDLRQGAAAVPIIVLADYWSQATLMAALRCGATDVVSTPLKRDEFISRLDDILAERLPTSIRVDRPQMVAGMPNLTRSEGRVLECVLSAMTTQQISRKLHVGAQTVAKHKQHVLQKLGVRNETELILRIIGNEHPLDISRAPGPAAS
jgi:DNA-binding NarL/FixJ family response regulator